MFTISNFKKYEKFHFSHKQETYITSICNFQQLLAHIQKMQKWSTLIPLI